MQENGISCMTVGTGSSMCAPLADACAGFVSSLILGSDAVPRLSHHTVENLLDELIRKSPALNFAESVRSSVASTFAPLAPASKANAKPGGGTGGEGAAMDSVQLAELQTGEGFAGLDVQGDAAKDADAPHAKAARVAAELGERGAHASVREGDVGAAVEEGGEGEVAAEEVAALGDGMAAAEAPPPVRTDGNGNVWQRLLRPVEGLLRGAREQSTPFSPESLRRYAQRWRDKAAKAAAEPGPDTDLAGVSVADPLRYLAESGISRSERMGAVAETAAAAAAHAGGATDAEAAETAAAAAAPAPALQAPLPSAPSGVRALDADLLREADAGHKAAAAPDAAPPPPLYPPGRIFWLIPLQRRANGTGGSLDVQVASSTSLLSSPKTLAAAEVFHADTAPATASAEMNAGVDVGEETMERPPSPVELQDRASEDRSKPGPAGAGADGPVVARAGTAGAVDGGTGGSTRAGDEPGSRDRSMFMQLAGDAMLGPEGARASGRPDEGQGEEDAGAEDELEQSAAAARPAGAGDSAPLADRTAPGGVGSPGLLTQAGADVASGAFEGGIGQRESSDGSEGWAADGGGAAPQGAGGEEVAPNWLLNFMRRQPRLQPGIAKQVGEAASEVPQNEGARGSSAEVLGDGTAGADDIKATSRGGGVRAAGEFETPARGEGGTSAEQGVEGQSYFVIEDSAGACAGGRRRESDVHDMAVLDVTRQRDVFNYLTLGADMIQDHLPDSYTKAVALLKRHAQGDGTVERGEP